MTLDHLIAFIFSPLLSEKIVANQFRKLESKVSKNPSCNLPLKQRNFTFLVSPGGTITFYNCWLQIEW